MLGRPAPPAARGLAGQHHLATHLADGRASVRGPGRRRQSDLPLEETVGMGDRAPQIPAGSSAIHLGPLVNIGQVVPRERLQIVGPADPLAVLPQGQGQGKTMAGNDIMSPVQGHGRQRRLWPHRHSEQGIRQRRQARHEFLDVANAGFQLCALCQCPGLGIALTQGQGHQSGHQQQDLHDQQQRQPGPTREGGAPTDQDDREHREGRQPKGRRHVADIPRSQRQGEGDALDEQHDQDRQHRQVYPLGNHAPPVARFRPREPITIHTNSLLSVAHHPAPASR